MQSGGDTDVIARQTSLPDAATLARVQAGTGTVVPWDARGGRGGAGQGGVVYGVHKVRGRDLHKNLVSMAGRAGQYLAAVDAVSRERKGAGKALRRAGSTPALAGDGAKAPAAAMLVVAKQSGAPGASGGAALATRKSHKKKAASLNTPLLQDGAGADEGGEEEGEAHMESHMLSADEVTIISATLDLRSKTVLTRMTPLDKAYLLSTEDVLSDEVMSHILESSHSRVPVFANGRRDCIVGLLIVKLLIKCDPDDSTPVSSLSLGRPLVMHPATPMFDALNGVPPPPTVRVLGLLTLEDVIEELIGEPIEDETDHMAVTGELRHMASWEGQ
ncbi:MAM3 [Symbiodinium sp. KB8]|nr:MAM3 [Symbiodinium sp. KB8]